MASYGGGNQGKPSQNTNIFHFGHLLTVYTVSRTKIRARLYHRSVQNVHFLYGTCRHGPGVKSVCCSSKGPEFIPSSCIRQFTTSCHFTSWGSDTCCFFFFFLASTGICIHVDACSHICPPMMYIIKVKLRNPLKCSCFIFPLLSFFPPSLPLLVGHKQRHVYHSLSLCYLPTCFCQYFPPDISWSSSFSFPSKFCVKYHLFVLPYNCILI